MKLVVEYTPTNSDIQSAICGKILNKSEHYRKQCPKNRILYL